VGYQIGSQLSALVGSQPRLAAGLTTFAGSTVVGKPAPDSRSSRTE